MVLKRPHTSHCLIWCVSVRVCVCVLGLLQRHWNLTPPNCNRSADTDSHTAVDGEDASNKQSQQSLLRWTCGRREEVLAEQGRGRVRKRRTGSKRWRAGETPCPGGFGVRRGHKPSPPGWDPSCSPTGWLWYYFFGPHFFVCDIFSNCNATWEVSPRQRRPSEWGSWVFPEPEKANGALFSLLELQQISFQVNEIVGHYHGPSLCM